MTVVCRSIMFINRNTDVGSREQDIVKPSSCVPVALCARDVGSGGGGGGNTSLSREISTLFVANGTEPDQQLVMFIDCHRGAPPVKTP